MNTQVHNRASRQWQSRFLQLLPAIKQNAERALRGLGPEARDDATSEVLAHATCAFAGLSCRGKEAAAFAGTLARFAIAGYRAGRRTGTPANSYDVYSKQAFRRDGIRRISIDQDSQSSKHDRAFRLRELLVDNRQTPVLDQVAFRIDFPAWLDTLKPRDRQITQILAMGYTTQEVSRKFNLSAGRISQLRRELADSWYEFIGDSVEQIK